jgi:hypothetical protein
MEWPQDGAISFSTLAPGNSLVDTAGRVKSQIVFRVHCIGLMRMPRGLCAKAGCEQRPDHATMLTVGSLVTWTHAAVFAPQVRALSS